MVLSKIAQGVMGGEENEQICVGQDRVCFDVEKEYGGEEDEVLWLHCPKQHSGEKIDAGEDGKQAAMGQTSNDLVSGFQGMDKAARLTLAIRQFAIGESRSLLAKKKQDPSPIWVFYFFFFFFFFIFL